jgi:copper(I)-binding protein
MKTRLIFLFALWCANLPHTLFAADKTIHLTPAPISVLTDSAWARWLPRALPAAGYLTLENHTNHPMTLVEVSSPDYAQVMLHQSISDGITDRMVHIDHLIIPAQGRIVLAPGGYHLMFEHATRPITPGSRIKVRLKFSNGQVLETQLPVHSPNGKL